MQRLLFSFLFAVLVAGCGTTPMGSEAAREIVLQYLGGDVGTVGPITRNAKNELGGLSEADRRKAEGLIDQGAVLFLVYDRNSPASQSGGASRLILVRSGSVVGDFHAQPRE